MYVISWPEGAVGGIGNQSEGIEQLFRSDIYPVLIHVMYIENDIGLRLYTYGIKSCILVFGNINNSSARLQWDLRHLFPSLRQNICCYYLHVALSHLHVAFYQPLVFSSLSPPIHMLLVFKCRSFLCRVPTPQCLRASPA